MKITDRNNEEMLGKRLIVLIYRLPQYFLRLKATLQLPSVAQVRRPRGPRAHRGRGGRPALSHASVLCPQPSCAARRPVSRTQRWREPTSAGAPASATAARPATRCRSLPSCPAKAGACGRGRRPSACVSPPRTTGSPGASACAAAGAPEVTFEDTASPCHV